MTDERSQVLQQLAGEVVRHLEWLRDAGVRELPVPIPVPVPVLVEVGRPVPVPVEVARPAVLTASPVPASAPSPIATVRPTLEAIRADLGDCKRCKLAGGRTHLVFGVGAPDAELMFVGEGPGADEDLQGEPFVGRAGQLLTRMIEGMGFGREQVYIANVVKCRPPQNRNPEPDEIAACEPFLRRQIEAVRPKVIVALGKFAAHTLLRTTVPITRLRGEWATYEGVRLMPTFHPAYLLRSPDEKGKAWADLKLVLAALGRPVPGRG